jgi:hypothetical protein
VHGGKRDFSLETVGSNFGRWPLAVLGATPGLTVLRGPTARQRALVAHRIELDTRQSLYLSDERDPYPIKGEVTREARRHERL